MKTMEEILLHVINNQKIENRMEVIDMPHYYNFENMLQCFLRVTNATRPVELVPQDICVVCVTYDAFTKAISNGFKAIYLYDHLDFTNTHYYIMTSFPQAYIYIIENADTLTADLIYRIYDHIKMDARLYVIYDSFIPRKYNDEKDAIFVNMYKNFNIEILNGNKSNHSSGIQSFLNKLRSKKFLIENLLKKENTFGNKLDLIETDRFLLSDIDLSKIIITPHRTLIRNLNPAIRRYLGLVNYDDEYKPMPNEWLISHGPSACFIEGKEITLPIGYRLKVKDVIDTMQEPFNTYVIIFDYTFPTGVVKEANIRISRTYIKFLMDNKIDEDHAKKSYNFYFGYVVEDFYFVNNSVDDAQIIYDHTLLNERRDLYSSLLPVNNTAQIFYNLKKRISFNE